MHREIAIGAVRLSTDRPRIVAAGGQAELDALAAAEGADVVELRADLFDRPRPDTVVAALARLRAAGRPVILTVRAPAEGGRPLDDVVRRELYLAGLPHADAVDVEIASTALASELVERARTAGRTVILSAHAMERTPPADTLLPLIDRAVAMGAAGTLGRLLLPAAGSLLTYGHVGTPTASGQLTVAELAALMRRLFDLASS